MAFGGRRLGVGRAAEARISSLPIDFMFDPHWTRVSNGLVQRHFDAEQISRLSRKDRDYAYRVVAHLDSPITSEQATRWYLQAPSGITAGLAGAAKVRDAKLIRAGRRLFEMDEDESQRYQAKLADADALLLNATVKFPNEVLAWIPRIDVARGLQKGLPALKRLFSEAQARERWHFLACESAFEGHTVRWGGSYAALFEFAVDAMAAPAGHPARSLIAFAEAERLTWDRNMDTSVMPARADIDFHAQFGAYVRNLPDDLDPDDVIGLGAWLYVLTPRDERDARYVIQALEVLKGRGGGYPYSSLNDPVAWHRRVLTQREEEAVSFL